MFKWKCCLYKPPMHLSALFPFASTSFLLYFNRHLLFRTSYASIFIFRPMLLFPLLHQSLTRRYLCVCVCVAHMNVLAYFVSPFQHITVPHSFIYSVVDSYDYSNPKRISYLPVFSNNKLTSSWCIVLFLPLEHSSG